MGMGQMPFVKKDNERGGIMRLSTEALEQAAWLTKEMIRFPSYEAEGKRALLRWLEDYIKKEVPQATVYTYDMDTTEPYFAAVLRCEEAKFRLMLQGHIDVVSPEGMEEPYSGREEGGNIYGRGASDMKSGCACNIVAFLEAAKLERTGEIWLVFSSDEEYSAAEMGKAFSSQQLPVMDLAVIPECTSGKMSVAHKGNAWLQVDFFGKSAHASDPSKGKNAISMANRFLTKLEAYLEHAYDHQEDPICGKPVMNVGVICGGSAPNVVPPKCTVKIDKRYLPGDTVDTFIGEMEQILAQCKEEDAAFEGKVSVIVGCTPLKFDVNSPLCQRVMQAINRVRETEVEVGFLPGWGEGGFIQNFGIPTFYLGPGLMEEAHTPTEYVPVKEIHQVAEEMFQIVLETCVEK